MEGILQTLSRSLEVLETKMASKGVGGRFEIWSILPTLRYVGLTADALEILSDWVSYGLDMEEAKTQTQPAFIIRHLKVGLKLATVLVTFNAHFCAKMMVCASFIPIFCLF